MIESFHLLRPAWLLVIPIGGLLLWLNYRLGLPERRWQHQIAPHLLKHLVVSAGPKQLMTAHRLGVFYILLCSFALAGPTWQKAPAPFGNDQAPLMIAMPLTESTLVSDLKPSRLARIKLKVRQLLQQRQGSSTGLVVYAGSAHTVLPATEDSAVLKLYLEDLVPEMMPESGANPLAALKLAVQLLDAQLQRGTVLLLTDPLSAQQLAAIETEAGAVLKEKGQGQDHQLIVWGMGPVGRVQGFDLEPLAGLLDLSDVEAVGFSADDGDLVRLQRLIHAHWLTRQAEGEQGRWIDAGYWLLYPLILVLLPWFRRGMVIPWR